MTSIFKNAVGFLLFLFAFNHACAQKTPDASVIVGFNFPSLELNETKLDPVTSPFFGFQIRKAMTHTLFLKASGLFGSKRSSFERRVDITQKNIELQLQAQKKLGDFYFHFGLLVDLDQGRSLSSRPNRAGLTQPINDLGNGNNFYFNLGTEFMVNESFNLLINVNGPFQSNSGNFQVGLAYSIGKNVLKRKSLSQRQRRITASKKQIQELQSGTLLFRLGTLQPKIDALRNAGLVEESKKIAEQQRKLNLGLVKAFKSNYSFSDVQFFYSYSSNDVREKKFDYIFLNDSLEIDSSIQISKNEVVYTAAFQHIKRDTVAYLQYEDLTQNNAPVYYGGTDYTFTALVVMNDQFVQLDRPFPYYTRAVSFSYRENLTTHIFFWGSFWKKKYDFNSAAKRFNRRLSAYFLHTSN